MSREGSGPEDPPDEGQDVSTEGDWPPFEQEEPTASDDWNLEEREQELQQKEGVLRDKEQQLRDRERELDKRERQIEQREQEVLDRREEIVDERDQIESRAEELDQREQAIAERESTLEGREEEIQSMEEGIESKIEDMGAPGSTEMFTPRPRKAGGVLLGLLGVAGIVVALTMILATGAWPAVFSRPLTSSMSVSLGNVVAVVLIVASLIEILGGFFAYRGRYWFVSIVSGIIAMALFFPVGLTATIFLTVGESQFE